MKGYRLARARGGPDAERAERERACNEAAEQERRNFDALQRMRCEGFRKVALLSNTAAILRHCEALEHRPVTHMLRASAACRGTRIRWDLLTLLWLCDGNCWSAACMEASSLHGSAGPLSCWQLGTPKTLHVAKILAMHAASKGASKSVPHTQRREALGQPAGDTDPFYDSLADHGNPVRGTLIRSRM